MSNKIESVISQKKLEVIKSKINDIVSSDSKREVVEIRLFFEYSKLNLTVFIWTKDGISLDDCTAVHEKVSDLLDQFEDDFADDYILNVSSSGIDRPIENDDDLRRSLDTEIEFWTKENAKKVKISGCLLAYDDQSITVRTNTKNKTEKVFMKNNIQNLQPHIRF